jgi:hypothetical protein
MTTETPVFLSKRQLAAEFACSRDLVRQIIDEAGLQPATKRGGYGRYRLRDFTGAFLAHRQYQSPYERLATARAVLTEDQVRVRRRELIEVGEHVRSVSRIIKICSRGIETAPDVLERDIGLTPKQAARLEAHFDGIRNEIAAAIEADDDSPE